MDHTVWRSAATVLLHAPARHAAQCLTQEMHRKYHEEMNTPNAADQGLRTKLRDLTPPALSRKSNLNKQRKILAKLE